MDAISFVFGEQARSLRVKKLNVRYVAADWLIDWLIKTKNILSIDFFCVVPAELVRRQDLYLQEIKLIRIVHIVGTICFEDFGAFFLRFRL